MTDRNDIYALLPNRPLSDIAVVCLRASCRVFPALLDNRIPDYLSKNLTFYSAAFLLIANCLPAKKFPVRGAFYLNPKILHRLSDDSYPSDHIADALKALKYATSQFPGGHSKNRVKIVHSIIECSISAFSILGDTSLLMDAIVDDLERLSSGEDRENVLRTPLWRSTDAAHALEIWDVARKRMVKWDGFDFWIRWYEALLVGPSIPSNFLDKIARINNKNWNEGFEQIASIIGGFELSNIQEISPLAEVIEWVPSKQKVQAVPIPMNNQVMWNTIVDKQRDALEDICPGGQLKQQHTALEGAVGRLRRSMAQYADSPQRVHDDIRNALLEIEQLIEEGSVADDTSLRVFRRTLNTNAVDIMISVPEVEEVVRKRTVGRLALLKEEDRRAMKEAVRLAADNAEEGLGRDLRADANLVLEPANGGGQGEQTEKQDGWRQSAAYRVVSRVSRIVPLLRKHMPEVVKQLGIQAFVASLVEWM